jgi:prepilin-type N-terminal cleavage/methylation domain-containing protein
VAFGATLRLRSLDECASRRLLGTGQGVRHRPSAPRCSIPRGVTLLELIVVIALLGLILAIAAPAFIVPSASHDSELTTVLGTARRAAILRGEPVTLAIDSTGGWRLDGDATPAAPPIATGTLGSSVGRLRIRVSPIGTCVADPAGGAPVVDWNALDCRMGVARAEAPVK